MTVGPDRGRRPTMNDVARTAGVSAMTVSYTYSQPARVSPQAAAKVRAAAEQLGYPGPHPGARSLRRGRAGSLGVVLGEHLTYAFEDPQAAQFLAGVAEVCAEQAVGLTLVPVIGQPCDAERVAEAAVDGFVVWTTADDDPMLDAVVATGLPAVVHGGPLRVELPTVSIDDRAAALAIGREAFTGARRPAVLSFPFDHVRRNLLLAGPDPQTPTFPVTRHRLQGLRDAWLQTGRPWSEVQVAVCSKNDATLAAERVADLLQGPDAPDAIAAMSDELALGVLHAATRAGLPVPDALAVTGWDDTDAAAPAGLTTVRQSLRDQGARCARLALGQDIEHEEPQWQVVRRRSTRIEAAT
jgi:DNA-binding LacI/PurR family transcriptional regulator